MKVQRVTQFKAAQKKGQRTPYNNINTFKKYTLNLRLCRAINNNTENTTSTAL